MLEAAPGDLDLTFNTQGWVKTDLGFSGSNGNGVAIQSDGKILMTGSSYNSFDAGKTYWAVVRYTAGGALDTTFPGTGIFYPQFPGSFYSDSFGIALKNIGGQDKILGVGYVHLLDGSFYDTFAALRLNMADGSYDTNFSGDGCAVVANTADEGYQLGFANSQGFGIAVQADNKVVTVGKAFGPSQNFGVARFTTSGTLDTASFGTSPTSGTVQTDVNGTGGSDLALCVVIQPDQNIVVAGNTIASVGSNDNWGLVRYNSNGTLDSGFGSGGIVVTDVQSNVSSRDFVGLHGLALQSDGKIIVAGGSRSGNDNSDFAVARYTTSGALDTTFAGTGTVVIDFSGSPDDFATSVAVQSNGKILVGGFSRTNGPFLRTTFVRLNPDGSLDATFGANGIRFHGLGSESIGSAMALQADGKIAAVGRSDGLSMAMRMVGDPQSTLEDWRQVWYNTTANSGNAADLADPDHDSLVNLVEWACNLNPIITSILPATLVKNGGNLEFTYTRAVLAVNAGTLFTVEWSDTLAGNDWHPDNVVPVIQSADGVVQRVKATLPAGSIGRRFVHLKVTAPP